jgi:hypothetical protein
MSAKATSGKSATLKRTAARKAIRAAKKASTGKPTPKAWKKGGREWSKVLGHFGATGVLKK